MYPVSKVAQIPDGISYCPVNKTKPEDFRVREGTSPQEGKYFTPEPLYLLEQLYRTDVI